jgi:hypothetical protein
MVVTMTEPVFTYPWVPAAAYKPAQMVPYAAFAQMVAVDSPLAATYAPVYVVADADVGAVRMALYGWSGAANVQVGVVGDALKVTTAGGAATGDSINGTAAASGIIKSANATCQQVIIMCVDAAETLYVSFNNPATVNDIALRPGMSITYNVGFVNAVYGLGSGAGAKYSIQELS